MFDKNVFVNCPFDDDYRQLLVALLFTIKYLKFEPRIALERADAGESRIEKILNLIDESKFGIHDLSRIVSRGHGEHYRMNMPFELGVDFGCKRLKTGKWERKQILVLEKEKFRYQKALSDLSGSDIRNHNDEPDEIVRVTRDWFVTVEGFRAHSGRKIWIFFNDFQAFLYDEVVEKDGHDSVDDVPIVEIMRHMDSWLSTSEDTHRNQ